MFIDVYISQMRVNMKGTREEEERENSIFSYTRGHKWFLRNTIHYTESFVTEETLARTHEGVGEGLFKPCTHKRIRSNYARDIKLEQRVRV